MIDVLESEAAFRERTKSPEELYERLLPYLGSWISIDYSILGFPTSFNRTVGVFEGMKARYDESKMTLIVSGDKLDLFLRTDSTEIIVRVGDSWKIIQPRDSLANLTT